MVFLTPFAWLFRVLLRTPTESAAFQTEFWPMLRSGTTSPGRIDLDYLPDPMLLGMAWHSMRLAATVLGLVS